MRKLLGILLGITLFMAIGTPAHAQIANPTTRTVNSFEAFRSVLNTNDQLYIITGSLEYAVNPTLDASETFLVTMSDNGTQIAATALFAFADNGYDDWVVSFYFAENNANLPAWGTANVSVTLTGNPALTWAAGSPPVANDPTLDNFTDTAGNTDLEARLRVIGVQLDNKYGASFDLIGSVNGVLKYQTQGETYFETVIANLRSIAPDLFQAITTQPEFDEREFTNTQKTTTEARWVGDQFFDMTALANLLGISRMWANSIIWTLFTLGLTAFIIFQLKKFRPALFLMSAMMVVGSFAGFMVFEAGIFVGVLGVLGIVWPLLFRSAA